VRLQEAVGKKTRARLTVPRPIPLTFKPFEIKTVRVEKDGHWSEVRMIEEDKA